MTAALDPALIRLRIARGESPDALAAEFGVPVAAIDAAFVSARNALVTANLPLAYRYVERWCLSRPGLRDDLTQAALMGLVDAAAAWDPDRARLSTCAWWKMRHRVQEFLRCCCKPLKTLPGTALTAFSDRRRGNARDEPPERLDVLAGVDRVRRAMRRLPQRQARCIEARAEGKTLEQVGEEIGMSKEGARQNHAAAVRRVRKMLGVKES